MTENLLQKAKAVTMSVTLDRPEWLLPEFDHVISLGDRCTSGLAIRENRFNQTTHLFDWLIVGGPANVRRCFEKDFQDFFFKKDGPPFNQYGMTFAHHSDLHNYEQNHATMQRRVDRLRHILNSEDSVLFLYTNEDQVYSMRYRERSKTFYSDMVQLVSSIEQLYPKLKFQVLYVDSVPRPSTSRILHAYVPFNADDFPIEIDLNNREIAEISGILYVKYREQCKLLLGGLPAKIPQYEPLK